MLTAGDIRQQFIDFFVKQHGHTFVPSSPVVPHGDDTLLFTNAGMNQFKPYFLGTEKPPYSRVANTQKCIRAGGKHNDLDDVGKDTYHHTFFEMLGNWSFGDYFKKEAILWAWELLTQVWGLDKSRLHATVFEGSPEEGVPRDNEAFEIWKTVTDIDPAHIHWGSKKDNFWEMGDTGPCGPCTEIHYDKTLDKSGASLVNAGRHDVIEIWNLVFIQYNRGEDGKLSPLPTHHVDTGMGFERITAILQGKDSNYDTDIFTPIFDAIQRITGADAYTGKLDDMKDIAYRVIADHIRCLTFALSDGAVPDNEGRGYVLRRILRRAERYGRQYLKTAKPFLCDLVPSVVELMGDTFPELRANQDHVIQLVRGEEESFIKTLDRGIRLFQEAADRARSAGQQQISAEDAFTLHDTHGVYIDITEQMASEVGLGVDRAGYERLMQEARERAREAQKKVVISALSGELPPTDDSPKYKGLKSRGTILGWVRDNEVIREGKLKKGEKAALFLDKTCFYAEQGGQVGDKGAIYNSRGRFEVTDTQKLGDTVLHLGQVTQGSIEVGKRMTLEVAPMRADIMRNHTATHLLNWALRRVLGDHVEQRGSLVDAEKTRFDFTHDSPLSAEEIAEIERLVNEKIYSDLPVTPVYMPLVEAQRIPGVRAVFGEKYPDPVRVLAIGLKDPRRATPDFSVEFCGGTHLHHTGEAGFFKIISQEGVAKGVRRVTAVTGRRAVQTAQQFSSVVETLAHRFNCPPPEIVRRVEQLFEENKKLQQQVKKGVAGDLQHTADRLLQEAGNINGTRIIVGQVPSADNEQIRQQVDRLRQKAGSAVVLLGWTDDGKVQMIAAVTDDLVRKGLHAGKLIGEVAKVVGGGGGGKPTMAQAGGKEPAKLHEALELGKRLVHNELQSHLVST
ncbi:MAG: alanine--tRNA ligase [Gemmatales bacterium]|nr:MAG: alanine--tRNA ligase [Gemmatales bacterium]